MARRKHVDVVDKVLVAAREAGRVKVQLLLRPTLVWLDGAHPRFAELLGVLEKAMISGTWVCVSVRDPIVEDVRPID